MIRRLKHILHAYRTLLVFCLVSFVLGMLVMGGLYWRAVAVLDELEKAHVLLTGTHHDTVRRLAKTQVELEVARASENSLRQMLDDNAAEIAEHEKALDFYRQLMVVDGNKEGFDLNSYTITRQAPDVVMLSLTFVQYAKKHTTLSASLSVSLKGTLNGEKALLAAEDLLVEPGNQLSKLRFKYFQLAEAQLRLPAGFRPVAIELTANIARKNAKPWQRELQWVEQ